MMSRAVRYYFGEAVDDKFVSRKLRLVADRLCRGWQHRRDWIAVRRVGGVLYRFRLHSGDEHGWCDIGLCRKWR